MFPWIDHHEKVIDPWNSAGSGHGMALFPVSICAELWLRFEIDFL